MPIVRSEQCLIVGDPKQLPPFDGDAVEVDGYGADEAKETLLDYLIPRLTPACVERLTHQHRMCAGIGGLISRCFYWYLREQAPRFGTPGVAAQEIFEAGCLD